MLCGTGLLEPTGTPQSGKSTKLIPMDRGVMVGESSVGPDVQRLVNALSALYPRGTEEKRLLDAMLLALPEAKITQRMHT